MTATTTPAVDTRAVAVRPAWVRMLATRAAAVLMLDVALFVLFTVLSQDAVFASGENIKVLLVSGTEGLLLTAGLTLLLGAGVFDLSLGANLVLSSVVGALVAKGVGGDGGAPIVAGLLACLLTGALFGLVNGVLVAYFQINALIATLGTLGIGTGVAYVLCDGADISGVPAQLQSDVGLATLGVVPVPAVIAGVIALAMHLMIVHTRFGLRTLALGSSRSAAERNGIRVPWHLTRLTVLAGALAGLAGFIDITRFAGTSVNGHGNDALAAVTAAVIGGTLLEGGKISMIGAVWGTGLAVLLQGGLVIVGVSSYYQLIVVGAVLIAAVGLDRVSSLRRARG